MVSTFDREPMIGCWRITALDLNLFILLSTRYEMPGAATYGYHRHCLSDIPSRLVQALKVFRSPSMIGGRERLPLKTGLKYFLSYSISYHEYCVAVEL